MTIDSVNTPKLRILLADDQPVLREGARLIINMEADLEVCCEANNGREAIAEAVRCHPDVAVLDLHMPGLDGLTTVREIRKQAPETEVVIFSADRGEEVIQQLFDAGVRSFIRKTDIGELLITAIRAAGRHQRFITPGVSQLVSTKHAHGGTVLSPRERQITALIADGSSNKEVASALGMSVRTVEKHRAAIMHKLGVSSTADVVRYAVRNGIVDA